MERTHPMLKANVDYRIPGDWFFKGIADMLCPIGVIGPRKLAGVCVRVHLGLDGSPRDGHDYAGLSHRLVVPAGYIGDGNVDDATVNCAASLALLPNKLQPTEANHVVVEVGDDNLKKVAVIVVDCAAEGVAKMVFDKKKDLVEEFKREEEELFSTMTPLQKEVMDTDLIAKCQRHIDQLHGGQLVKNETEVQLKHHVQWNLGRRTQVWLLSRVIFRRRGSRAVRVRLYTRAIAAHMRNKGKSWKELPSLDYTHPMEREKVGVKNGKAVYKCFLTELPPNIWAGLCSVSNLCANKVTPFPSLSIPLSMHPDVDPLPLMGL
jgi:hypothetical protein